MDETQETPDVEMTQEENFKSTDFSAKWLEEFEKSETPQQRFQVFTNHCTEHWAVWVPKIYSPGLNENTLSWNFNEALSQEILFAPLEDFICNGDPAVVLQQLSQADKHASVCGKFFKSGEPTYSCRECGMDKTCVLCVECFKNSEHRFHKYRMGMSSGGGCCDCGDTEAWRTAPFCSLHSPPSPDSDGQDILPSDLIERTRIVFDTVMWYCFQRLASDEIADVKLGAGISPNLMDLDIYCTILYNDEVHTFEQVITTLGRVLKCPQRESTEYVTNIDREGRAIVKCSSYQHCTELKLEIEKYTSRHGKPLKVSVNHAHVIAHQIFAMKLLNWLEKFLGIGRGFRKIFTECASKPSQTLSPCLITEIMLHDSSLWKSARTQFHRLLSAMLLEYENKKVLAKLFTKNYAQITKDFIRDDHEHSFSIASISVQLFTVPTLAHYLIENDDVLFIVLNTLLSEYWKKCNKNGKLEFERNPQTMPAFKRTLFMLFDLKYLLTCVPEQWTDALRSNFLHGLTKMTELLVKMQGMDAVTRQVGQHMEYEPEWESGFNLHIKLAACISSFIAWAATDRVVLIKSYRWILKCLGENPCYDPNEAGEVRELADHSTACLHYDVSSKPVSIHLPLSRLLAALHLHLEQYKLHFDSSELSTDVKPTPVQIIEPVLRAQVMIAQVHSGMWRRNGYALLNTLFFYHNVKCRTEMLDRDVNLLQMGASLIESNEFLIHVLNKFNLINWALPDFESITLKSPEEDNMRQIINLVEELFHLLIVIVGERYMPGVSQVTIEDRVKKDIIQSLCIKPASHSELVKSVSDDLDVEDSILDDVIKDVATFKKPTQIQGKGVYQLKEEYYDQFNVFFYHYTREEQSRAEEAHRKRRSAANQLVCCPPPKLPKLTDSFTVLVNLLQCDVMLHIMQTVFVRCLNLRNRSFSEPQVHKVLHLIGYALQEEESGNYPFFRFIENSAKFNLFSLMEEILECPRIDAHKGLLQWTLNKYKEMTQKEAGASETEPQKEQTSQEKSDDERQRRAKLAAEKRAKIMAQMQAAQNNFINQNAKLFEETAVSMDTSERTPSTCEMEVNELQPIALGPNQSLRMGDERTEKCILCIEEVKITAEGPTMVLAAYVQQSTVLCQHKNNQTLLNLSQHDPLFLHANLGPAPHTNTCGHVMHADCWRKHFDGVMVREHRRPYRLRHPSSFDVDKQEFLCPLCESLSNTVLPLVPPLSKLQPTGAKIDCSFEDWLKGINTILQKKNKVCHGIFQCNYEKCENLHCTACVNASSGTTPEQDIMEDCDVNCMLQPHQIFYACPVDKESSFLPQGFADCFLESNVTLSTNLRETIRAFAQVTYTRGLNTNPHPSDKRLAPLAWKSLAYTIHSIEIMLQAQNKPLLGDLSSRQRDSLENLLRIVGVLNTTWSRSVVINSHALNLLTVLFEHKNDSPSLLQWDSFGFLVSLTFSLPCLLDRDNPCPIPTGGTLDWHILRIIFISHIVRILILMNPEDINSDDMEADTPNVDSILDVLRTIGKHKKNLNAQDVWKYIKTACRPFLRCCVLFYHYLTEVPPSAALLDIEGGSFEDMCLYLDLPQSPKQLFESPGVQILINRWCGHEEVESYLNGTPLLVIEEPIKVPQLIDLPMDYSELINTVSTFTCPNSEEDCRNPTICLVCGTILCSQSYCCQAEYNKIAVGACNLHASKCGAGMGIFLRIRECEVLLLTAPYRGCFITPPYLDDYGETDQGLRRGNPLKLCVERYKKLHTMWLSHGIHEEISRQIETSNHIVATQWNML